jgi:hypothetical protein
MTIPKQIFLSIAVLFCLTTFAETNTKNIDIDSTKKPLKQKDTSYWVHNLKQFRAALYIKDKSTAKEFVDFPFKNQGNEIWYLAYSNNEKALDKLNKNVKPFTEKDFDKYFDAIFSNHFIKCLLRIKADELYKSCKSESPVYTDGLNTYILYATYHKAKQMLVLNFATKTAYKISETEYETGETNFIYQFVVLKNGFIKLKRIEIAG